MKWDFKKFEDLTVRELYAFLRLRSLIFHLEQNCAYVDLDNKDQASIHVLGWDNNELAAYARIVPAGIAFNELSIGRVVTAPAFRGKGLGKELMKISLEEIRKNNGAIPVRIGAQCYLNKFYGEFGFITDGNEYLEDNIPHIEMIRNG